MEIVLLVGRQVVTDFVDRPASAHKYNVDYPALFATAENGKAIRVLINGNEPSKVRDAITQGAKRNGYFVHTRRDGDAFICWTEKRWA